MITTIVICLTFAITCLYITNLIAISFIYRFKFRQLLKGWCYSETGRRNIYVYKPFSLNPIAIFWLYGKREQYQELAKLMCEQKQLFGYKTNSIKEDTNTFNEMYFNKRKIWPNKAIRDILDPEGWCPDDDD